jgi:hypothetical protein
MDLPEIRSMTVSRNATKRPGGICPPAAPWRAAVRTVAAIVAVFAMATAHQAGGAVAPLPITSFTDLAVDEDHDSVYVTSGSRSSEITVLNLDGSPKRVIEGVVGALDIARAHDGSALYVAISDQRAIGTINASTGVLTKRSLGRGVCPTSLAQVGQTLWFTYDDCVYATHGNVGSLRLPDGALSLGLMDSPYRRLVSSPALPGRLLAPRPTVLELLDVSAGANVQPSIVTMKIGEFDQVTVTPDGTEAVAGAAYSTSTLEPMTNYGSTGPVSAAIDIRSDGLIAIGASDLTLYQQGNGVAWRRYRPTANGETLWTRGLAFGGRDLYVIGSNSAGALHFVRITPRRASSLSVSTSASSFEFGATPRVTAHLSGGATNRMVSLYAQPTGQARRLLTQGNVDANGDISASVRLDRRTTLVATYAGDDAFDGVTTAKTVTVRARLTARLIGGTLGSDGITTVKVAARPTVAVSVAPNHAKECVRVGIQFYGAGKWWPSSSPCLTLDQYSRARFKFAAPDIPVARMRVRAIWNATPVNDYSTSPWVYMRVVQ